MAVIKLRLVCQHPASRGTQHPGAPNIRGHPAPKGTQHPGAPSTQEHPASEGTQHPGDTQHPGVPSIQGHLASKGIQHPGAPSTRGPQCSLGSVSRPASCQGKLGEASDGDGVSAPVTHKGTWSGGCCIHLRTEPVGQRSLSVVFFFFLCLSNKFSNFLNS